jgi:rubrerythrin
MPGAAIASGLVGEKAPYPEGQDMVMMGKSSTFVSASQVLRRLAEIEQEGASFYEGLLEGTQSEWIRKLAKMLIKAERRHKKRFLEYAERAEARADANSLARPLSRDVIRLLTTPVVVSKDEGKQSAPHMRDEEALKLAIRAEENIALLLAELREYVPKDQRRYISRVIKEEWHHKAELEKIYRKTFR